MINAKIYKDQRKNIIKFFITGHAGFENEGLDIVCAAVSVLVHTALVSLNKVCKIDEKDIDYFIDDDNGVMKVSLPGNLGKEKREKANIVLRSMELGLISIVEVYPENVALEYREV
ncbi:MAG TPA: ribosomal-processing cysteine protease Prp [Tissierellales bacterium]|nr:ribosomal-processing cysteine protease Prp [Tissierellales bacterium]